MHAFPARSRVPEASPHSLEPSKTTMALNQLTAGGTHFLVDSKFVRVISPSKSTCFSVAADLDMPSAEGVASALLQLKNNARLFEKWRDWLAHTFKANGKMFRDTYHQR